MSVRLTRQQIEASPEAHEDEPLTKQMEAQLYDYYGWDPSWGSTYFGANAIVTSPAGPPIFAEAAARQAAGMESHRGEGDPHLRSVASVNGYHVHATDGDLGHVENFVADDANWDIRYLVIATRNWWPGKHVQLAPYAVKEIDWSEERINVNVTRDQVKSSPAWDPLVWPNRSASNSCIAILAGRVTAGRKTSERSDQVPSSSAPEYFPRLAQSSTQKYLEEHRPRAKQSRFGTWRNQRRGDHPP